MYKLISLNLCIGRFHTETAARMAAEVNKVQARVVKSQPYELPDFTISHEFKIYGLLKPYPISPIRPIIPIRPIKE